jgi:YbbR domain-containing protein
MLFNFKYNIKAIIGSLIVAFILWFMVATEKEYTHQIKIPIELVRLARGKTLKKEIPENVIVEVKGKGKALIGLWFYDKKLRLELPRIKKSHELQLKDYIHLLDLPGLELVQIIEPEKIDLEVDDLLKEKKPIAFSGNIGVEKGYILINYHFSVDSALVYGPKSMVKEIKYIYTDTLELVNKKNRFNQEVELLSPYPRLVRLNPGKINIEFDIQRLIERVVYNIPITVKNVPSYLAVEVVPNTLSLRIKGGQDIVAKVEPDFIKADIDFMKSYRSSKEKYVARIVTPSDLSWIESIPKTFILKVKRK